MRQWNSLFSLQIWYIVFRLKSQADFFPYFTSLLTTSIPYAKLFPHYTCVILLRAPVEIYWWQQDCVTGVLIWLVQYLLQGVMHEMEGIQCGYESSDRVYAAGSLEIYLQSELIVYGNKWDNKSGPLPCHFYKGRGTLGKGWILDLVADHLNCKAKKTV